MPKLPVRKLTYATGTPTETGVYACRVPYAQIAAGLCDDVFLTWFEGRWYYTGGSERYRGEVLGWIGPLPRTRQKKDS